MVQEKKCLECKHKVEWSPAGWNFCEEIGKRVKNDDWCGAFEPEEVENNGKRNKKTM